MIRPFYLFEQLTNVVERDAGLQPTEAARLDGEAPPRRSRRPLRHARAKELVHQYLERPTGATRFGLEPRRDIRIQGEGGSHIMMLAASHHDVYFGPWRDL